MTATVETITVIEVTVAEVVLQYGCTCSGDTTNFNLARVRICIVGFGEYTQGIYECR